MTWFNQMDQFVRDDVFQTFRRLLCQVGVEPSGVAVGVAASPLGFHALHKNLGGFHVHQCFPLLQQRRQCQLELFAVPGIQQLFTAFRPPAWAHTKHDPVVLEVNDGNCIAFNHGQQIPLAPQIVTLSVYAIARGFAFLCTLFALLAFDS